MKATRHEQARHEQTRCESNKPQANKVREQQGKTTTRCENKQGEAQKQQGARATNHDNNKVRKQTRCNNNKT